MKRLVSLLLSISMFSLIGSSCTLLAPETSRDESSESTEVESSVVSTTTTYSETDITTELAEITETTPEYELEPQQEQIQYVCQLATIECYYHNVARSTKTAGTGVSHLGEEDTEFWFEYSAQATLGIDASSVYMIFNGNHITVYMPHAAIIGNITVDPESVTDPVYPPHRWYQNDVVITASDVTRAMDRANDDIAEEIINDPMLLSSAERRAQELIQSYIDQIVQYSGSNYEVDFEFIDEG